MEAVEAVNRAPGVLKLGGREFVILPPTPRDMLAVRARMEALAGEKCVSPLDFALKHTHLPPALLAVAVTEAIKLGSGGGVKPHPDAVWDEYASLTGVRWRVWYHVSRVLGDAFTLEGAAALVTDDNLLDASEALDAALRLKDLDPNAQAPATGTAS